MQSEINIDPGRVIARLKQRLDDETMSTAQYAALCDQLSDENAVLTQQLQEARESLAAALNDRGAIVLTEDGSRVVSNGEATEAGNA